MRKRSEVVAARAAASNIEQPRIGHRGLGDPVVQAEHLERVSTKLQGVIVAYLRSLDGDEFTMRELVSHVQRRVPSAAPDSPSRCLRSMRTKGVVDYDVVSRHDSQYRLISIGGSVLARRSA